MRQEHQEIKDFLNFMNYLKKAGLQNAFCTGNLIKTDFGFVIMEKKP